jgi:hypothetical protein
MDDIRHSPDHAVGGFESIRSYFPASEIFFQDFIGEPHAFPAANEDFPGSQKKRAPPESGSASGRCQAAIIGVRAQTAAAGLSVFTSLSFRMAEG